MTSHFLTSMFWLTTPRHKILSFMDGFSGYTQIKIAPEDMEKTAFVTQWGTFYYKVMPFGLKNAGATYQGAMVALFHDMIHHEIEVYVDDMISRYQTEEEHLNHLHKLFERLKKYKLRLNPNKCTFGVRFSKLWVSSSVVKVLKSILPRSKPFKKCLLPVLRRKLEVSWDD